VKDLPAIFRPVEQTTGFFARPVGSKQRAVLDGLAIGP